MVTNSVYPHTVNVCGFTERYFINTVYNGVIDTIFITLYVLRCKINHIVWG